MARVNWNFEVERELGWGNAKKIVGPIIDQTVAEAKARALSLLPEGTGQTSAMIEGEKNFIFPRAEGRAGVLRLAIHKGSPWRAKSKFPRPTVADVLVMQHKGVSQVQGKTGNRLFFVYNGQIRRPRVTGGFPPNKFLVDPFLENAKKWGAVELNY